MAASKYVIRPLAVLVVLLFAGVQANPIPYCAVGCKDCDYDYRNGCEVNTVTDVNNCGNCGYKCAIYCGINAVPVCKSSKCEFTCKAPFLNCDNNWKNGCEVDGSKDNNNWKNGCEVDGSKDNNNCGACGKKCVAPPYATAKCYNGKCEYVCMPGWKNCDGKWENGCETDVGKDLNNCGNCGTKCTAAPNSTPKCNNYKCENTCKPTFADCDKNPANGCETCTAVDPKNCGACGVECAEKPNAVSKCNGGKCEYSCKPGFSNCDGDWTNGCEATTGGDVNNCGACGAKCKDMPNAVTKCTGGKCVYSCKAGFSNCDGDWTDGCEASTGIDVSNCGACGVKCAEKPNAVTKCASGKCEYSCKPGFSNCDGDWTNGCEAITGGDVNNCGACGAKCKEMPNAVTKCAGGKCVYTCKPEFSNCNGDWTNGCEASTGTDGSNCGACGVKCADKPNAATKCAGGKCVYSCKPGFSNCDGDWTNGCEASTGSDTSNCGACGVKCSEKPNAITKCNSGKCEYSCKPGFSNCDGDWTNGCEATTGSDASNCGACGVKCADKPDAVTKCAGGKCVYTCKPGFSNCDSYWTNGCEASTGGDVNNWGACGAKCKEMPNAVMKCAGGKCVYTCKPGFSNCDGDWTNGCEASTGTDVSNCGTCGEKCAEKPNAVTKCNRGKCEYTCKPGFSNCDGDWTNGCEASTGGDTNNCGACGVKCKEMPNATTKCTGGKCVYSCKPGFSNCDGDWTNGCEASTGTDASNCGACGVKCKDMPNAITNCAGGKCVYTCKPGFSNCDGDWTNGCEASTRTNTSNCGACGVKCAEKPNAVTKCNGGKCEYTCKPGYSNCDGDWTNGCEGSTSTDTNNCGACGTKCKDVANAVTKCYNGKCDYYCKPGFFNCDGNWVNGCEGVCSSDPNNCGACGVKCKDVANGVTKCTNGKCVYTCKPGFANCDNNWMNGCESTTGTDVNNCGACGNKCPAPKYAYGEAKCTNGMCETQSCKSGYKWEDAKKCCVDSSGNGGWY